MKKENDRIRPDFYERFTCTADKCPITCCQEWKIAVDPETTRKWKTVAPPENVAGQKKKLGDYTIKKDDGLVIGLDKDHRCPFLSEDRLCRLVCAYNDTSKETKVLFQIREQEIRLLKNEEKSVQEVLMESFYILLELQKEGLSEDLATEYFSEKTLEELEAALRKVEIPLADTIAECNELLQDLAVNYRREGLYQRFLDPVLEKAEKLSDGFDDEDMMKKWVLFQRQFNSYTQLFRCYLQNEIFSDLVMPEGTLEQSLMQLQWIAMTYVAIRQSLFLYWMRDGCGELAYETVRDYMVVISRMTGYDEENIEEYLENSFEMLLWDWGYFALIVGC